MTCRYCNSDAPVHRPNSHICQVDQIHALRDALAAAQRKAPEPCYECEARKDCSQVETKERCGQCKACLRMMISEASAAGVVSGRKELAEQLASERAAHGRTWGALQEMLAVIASLRQRDDWSEETTGALARARAVIGEAP